MDCNKFETLLSSYVDGMLEPSEASLFRAHSLQCRDCRALIDDVRATISECRAQQDIEPPIPLESALEAIPSEHRSLGCEGFEELITEFLDGFVPAATYHRFEEHANTCDKCSTILTDVVYAVAACHSVHTFEEVEISSAIEDQLLAIMPERKLGVARKIANRFAAFAGGLLPRATQSARWTYATAALLAFATFSFLLFGFSDDRTVGGIYRQAHVKFSELYTRGADVYTQTDKAVARLERVGIGIGELWETLGGESKNDGRNDPPPNGGVQKPEKN